MIATVGGGPSLGSQAGEPESGRWEPLEEQEEKDSKRRKVAECFKRCFLTKDKDVSLGGNR
jgi:hypothetical protein